VLENAMLLGRGFSSDVFAWGEGRVLKMFHRGRSVQKAEQEFQATKAIHDAGLPAPAAFELIEVDGRIGIVFERIEGRSLFEEVQLRPWTLFAAARRTASLHASIHAFNCPAELPSLKSRLKERVDAAERLSLSDRAAAISRLESLPDGETICHGDFHPANIVCTRRGLVVIDWGAACRGPGLADVACTSRLFDIAGLPPWAPWYMHWLLKCSRTLLHRTYLRNYLIARPGSRAELSTWKDLIAVAAGVH
jgi:Ser/Thr protein kinase RdoA (MazF antagonist)